jgi:prepilin-type N-terminal cleavage/methylation domain-containing protein
MKRIPKTQRAFTLVELLVVIAIIAALAAMTVALYSRVAGKTNESAIRTELEQIKLAIQVYKEKNGYFPPSDENGTANNQLFKNLSGEAELMRSFGFTDLTQLHSMDPGEIKKRRMKDGIKNLLPDLKPPFCAFSKAPHFCARHQGQCFDPAKHRARGHHSVGEYDFFGNLVSPALGREDSKQNERWNYNSNNPTHNRETYDLWVEIGEPKKLRIIGNWESN